MNHNMHVIYTPERFIQKSSGFNFGAFLFFSLGFQAHSSPGFKIFLIKSKVSAMCWHIFPLWQRLFCHNLQTFNWFWLCETSVLWKIWDWVDMCLPQGGTWLIMKAYSKRLNLCHKPLPSVLWAYVMNMWYVQK